MHILIVIMIVTVTDLIPGAVGASFDDMHKPVLLEDAERPEDVRLVDGEDLVFQLRKRHRTQSRRQLPDHDDTVGRRLDTVLLQQLHTFCFVQHLNAKVIFLIDN